jgi:hypothetical protein
MSNDRLSGCVFILSWFLIQRCKHSRRFAVKRNVLGLKNCGSVCITLRINGSVSRLSFLSKFYRLATSGALCRTLAPLGGFALLFLLRGALFTTCFFLLGRSFILRCYLFFALIKRRPSRALFTFNRTCGRPF